MLSKRNYILRGISFAFFTGDLFLNVFILYWRNSVVVDVVIVVAYVVVLPLVVVDVVIVVAHVVVVAIGFVVFVDAFGLNSQTGVVALSYIFLAIVLVRRNSRLLVIKHGLGV